MKATKLIRDKGLQYAKEIVDSAPSNATEWNEGFEFQCGQSVEISKADREKYFVDLSELKRLVDSVELVNNCGGLAIANKITFQKRLRNEKATHFIQHPENQKLIQLLGRNQRKPKEAIKFDLFEQAIRDHESIYGGGDD
ncbi:hypothetical protein JD510_19060 [Acinetobacter pittii]|uniref:hypothetical protein n=1 Tax=Acinetobacter pittii TaxID=48296 RepID=UPI000839AB3D|nr:hypothetical protein [Acinetobacter pittii]MBK0408602.1 hypothetical protein [Acinetobacter pittii]MCK0889935.1 hypothetical protein [Acinetobacter pittii]OCY70344.1 hypothetical protein BFR86_14600 [Acinetobacter pittii]OCY75101.1 hypothetical protein BFR87_16495 [Acinetobacter pittii]OCY76016.1 hypothetical protein BFR88_14280 [Acinetobacter pittii]